ncbi:unnamed protein product [Nyctereutes procyonoides]|uniref:(raccoon dog) hypothetical protein n=1 Tax=Nyctereutes procyonoides TaxID=34880 RepID=A0A811ZPD8_NYCPR|nr:unnamed protein product [Nyctereutes procyonoides]
MLQVRFMFQENDRCVEPAKIPAKYPDQVLSSLTVGQLREKEKDEDGFWYVSYSGDNTFGF